ncbi:phage portal protein [Comamonas sp. BIGb0124]|uniref:phage portal protein n=1 Tax=Comamonas sp. BIGb0124 TaxID=2485130 RepID=UPI00351A8C93
MRHRAHQAQPAPTAVQASIAPSEGVEMFTFGEPEVVDRASLLDYVETAFNGRFYEPPMPLDGLASAFRASPHHSSAIYLKRNILAAMFEPHPLLTHATFEAMVLDFLVFGNCYAEDRRAITGRPMGYQHSLARFTRRGKDGRYFFVQGWQQAHEFAQGSIFHLREADINQEVYGLPEYLSALQAALLNKSATMFRRRYYDNGSHAGFIMYLSDAAVGASDVDTLRDQLRRSKGPGNFRNLFVHAPNGKADGLKLIPVSEIAAKDDFTAIKSASREDVLAAHRVPPGLLGIIPNSTGGFGNPNDALRVFIRNEVLPLQGRFRQMNEWAGDEVVRFGPYLLDDGKPA